MKKLLISSILTFFSIALIAGINILPPQLVSPEHESVKNMPDVVLDWNAVSGIGQVSYLLEIDTEDTFSNPMSYSMNVTSFTSVELSFGETYFWHVKALDDNGESDWSETFSFTVFERLEPWKPSDGDDNLPPIVELKWKSALGGNQLSGFDFIDIMYDTSNYWQPEIQEITTNNLMDVRFINEDLGFVCGASGTLLKYDAGMWIMDTIWYYDGAELADTTIANDLMAITLTASNQGYIAGENGTLILYDGMHWILNPFTLSGGTGAFDGNLTAVSALDNDHIWLCDDNGGIISNTTGEWVLDEVGSDPYNSLVIFDANSGWAVGNKGELASYDGTAWTELDALTGDDLFAVDFLTTDNGFAVGESGTTLHFDGTDWMEIESNTKMDLFFVKMVSDNDAWAGGEEGRLAFFNGFDWVELASGSMDQLNGFHGLNESTGWMVGDNGTIIHRNGNGFNSPAMQIVTTDGNNTSKFISELYFGVDYFWKIRARHGADTSNWSASQYFSTLDQTSLALPADNASHQMVNVLLDWDGIEGAFQYIVEVCEDPTFAAGCTFFADTDSLRMGNLLFGTTYYWHVKASHTQDTTMWSDTWTFSTLDMIDQLSPEDGAFVPELFPTMAWEDVTGVDGFNLVYGGNENFNDAIQVDLDAPSNEFKVLYILEQDSTYFWKIRAFRDGDTTLWSPVWSFTIGQDTVGGVQNIFSLQNVNVYPNPANNSLFIDVNIGQQKNAVVRIMDVLGKVLIQQEYTFEPGLNTRKIDTSKLESGLYIVRIQSGESFYALKILID